jgi:hypothetical protein
MRGLLSAWGLLSTLLFFNPVWAHSSSNSFIEISQDTNGVSLRVDLPLRDLDLVFDLDLDGDGAVTWQEVRQQQPAIDRWLASGLLFTGDAAPCDLGPSDWAAARYGDEVYLSLMASLECQVSGAPAVIAVRYQLFFDQDTLHRGLLKASLGGKNVSAVFSPERPEQTIDPAKSGFFWVLSDYLIEGVWHIWIGADHILFLISLLIPCVYLRQASGSGGWRPVEKIRPALVNVLAVVTAFTLAHSVTLGLTVLEIVTPPEGIVEPVIAASVIVAALANLTRHLVHLRWQIALGFGLIHGFGFASVLSDLGLPKEQLTAALLGFNIGVELGQLAIVSAFFPVAWALRRTAFYRWGIMVAGSISIAAVAAFWLMQRLMP